ncbi:MAG: ribosome biogenesis GTPase Der [Alphaproteobacteria bacterium]|nr:ribosome biogenesis GTPase Der [Alphaproteobacteria bacterium]
MALKLAIVGRPNVGKSTLFNRLAGKRLAIVDDRPGVTRDRRHGPGRLGDLDLDLIDTAGFEDLTDESLEARMRAQTELAVAEADIVLLLIDARIGITPADERFADLLRRADKPVILAANKAEGRAAESGILEAFSLGLGEPIPISAEHGEGMSDLFAALVAAAPAPEPVDDLPDTDDSGDKPIRIAVIGRPNAGKSTLVNAILGEDRMLTGPEAGITRDAISIDFNWGDRLFRIVDTAGMRRKAKVEGKLEELSVADTIRSIRFADVCVLVMDCAEALEKQDLTIGDLVIREGRALVCVLAKWDKEADPKTRFEDLIARMGHVLPQAKGASVIPLSAIADQGLDDLRAAILEAYRDWNARVKTNDLNRWLKTALERHPPPAVDGKRIKPRYITQIKARPPTFVLMCSRASALPDTYKRYLVNGIREAFDMPGAPIRLFVRQNRNPYADGAD